MPDWKAELRKRLRGSRLDATRETGIIEELSDFLDQRFEELTENGVSERDARRQVLAELNEHDLIASLRSSGIQPEIESLPSGGGRGNWLSGTLQDLRYAFRSIRRNPGFTVVVVLTLALGIAANTTVFTFLNTLLLNPLPIERVSQLVGIDGSDSRKPAGSAALSYPNIQDVAQGNRVFDEFAAYTSINVLTWRRDSGNRRVFGELVTGGYFHLLGLRPAVGRLFSSENDNNPGTHPETVISYALWQSAFGGDPGVVGQTMRLGEHVFTVIGVAPKGFKGITALFGPSLWIPATMAEQVLPAATRNALHDRSLPLFYGAARLKPGVTLQQAEADLKRISSVLTREYPDANRGRSVGVRTLTAAALGDARQGMLAGGIVVLPVVALVLLIACSNAANLLLARAAARRKEIAVRLAMGAKRSRLIRQLLTESLLLAALAGGVGLFLACQGTQLLWSFRPAEVADNFVNIRLDGNVLLFAMAVSVLTGVLFGIMPALVSSRADVSDVLKEEGRSVGRSRGRVTLGNALLVTQVAFSLVCLTLAALFLRSMQKAYRIDPGFDTAHLAIMMTNTGQAGYDQTRTEQFYKAARTQIAALPGVETSSWASNLPFWSRPSQGIWVEGQSQRAKSELTPTIVNTVDVNYFRTMDLEFVRGRDFNEQDIPASTPVAVINETTAARYWPGQNALGKRFRLGADTALREVVGIVKTANYQNLGETPQTAVYVPLRQNYSDTMTFYVRTVGDPVSVLPAIQERMRLISPELDLTDVRTGSKLMDQVLFASQAIGLVLSVFGLMALALASVGLYGVMAYSITVRQREIGLRMALGASRSGVLQLVLRQGLSLVGVGAAVGLAASIAIGAALSKTLYSISPADPVSITVAPAVLLCVAAMACCLPAWRASRVDPSTALRD